MKKHNIIQEKSLVFAIRIVELAKSLQDQKEFIISKQILRSGTAIGAMVREAEHAESGKDFIHKLSIGLKEANETRYWLTLLHKGKYVNQIPYDELNGGITELIRILARIIKTSKQNLNHRN